VKKVTTQPAINTKKGEREEENAPKKLAFHYTLWIQNERTKLDKSRLLRLDRTTIASGQFDEHIKTP